MDVGRPDECAERVKRGATPDDISIALGLNFSTVSAYIDRAIGERKITRSEVLLNIRESLERDPSWLDEDPDTARAIVDRLLQRPPTRQRYLTGDVDYLIHHGYAATLTTDLFRLLADIEHDLHAAVSSALISHFNGDDAWWRNGVPARIRDACNRWQQADPEPAHPFSYTSLGHLASIIEHNWSLFEQVLPPDAPSSMLPLQGALHRLKSLRNRIAHPTRPFLPGREDYETTRHWRRVLAIDNWQLPSRGVPLPPA